MCTRHSQTIQVPGNGRLVAKLVDPAAGPDRTAMLTALADLADQGGVALIGFEEYIGINHEPVIQRPSVGDVGITEAGRAAKLHVFWDMDNLSVPRKASDVHTIFANLKRC